MVFAAETSDRFPDSVSASVSAVAAHASHQQLWKSQTSNMTIENVFTFPVMNTMPEMSTYEAGLSQSFHYMPQSVRTRNHSGGSTGSQTSSSSASSYGSEKSLPAMPRELLAYHLSQVRSLHTQPQTPQPLDRSSCSSDRSMSSTSTAQKNINPTRYKTEMCRPFEESGHCKYGDKCQFAHGQHELRNLSRHPKYKTEMCRTFHTVGFCPYGPRCHFVHNEDDLKLTEINHLKQQHVLSQVAQQVAQHQALASRLALSHQQVAPQEVPKRVPFVQPMATRPSQIPPRPQSLDFRSLSSLPMSLGSTVDSPPSSIADSTSPSLSPTSMLSDDVFSTVPSPPPGFSALPANAPVFNFANIRSSTPLCTLPVTSARQVPSPVPDPVASLVAGLQETSIAAKPRHYHHGDGIQGDANPAFSHFAASAPLTPPSSVADSFDDSLTSESPDSSLVGPRLPIFSMLATFTEVN